MKSEKSTRLSIDVPNELHKSLKIFVFRNHLNIKNYVLNLIKEDLSEELEDYLLGEAALKAEKEGNIGVKASKKFLEKLRKSETKITASKTLRPKKSLKK